MATCKPRNRERVIRRANNSPPIVCVDLFCGLGGLTHGLIKGGVQVAAGIDIDTQCRFPYQENNDATFIEADVRNLSSKELRVLWKGGAHSLLAGCAPCQPFSTYSRKGRGSRKDTKWELVADFGRLVSEARPDFVTMENVPQLVDHQVFAAFLETLNGYHIWWDVIECAQYGVPQTRKRLVLLASQLGPISLLPPIIDKNGNPATVRHAISRLPPIAAGESDPNDAIHAACSLSELNLRRIRASRPGGTWRDWDKALVANCHRKDTGETYPSVYGRMEWDAPAPTITTQSFGYGNGRFGHPEQDRAISLREAAILQTFPETYRFLREGERLRYYVLGRLIGNAVPVRIGEIVARSLLNHLAGEPTRGILMKPLPALNVPGDTEWERFDNAVHAVFKATKDALLKEEAKRKLARKKRAKKHA
jgi:DNA (cytosine-5)-methyltransferase 1